MDPLTQQSVKKQLEQFNIPIEKIKNLRTKLQTEEISDTSFIIPKEQLQAPSDSDYIDYSEPNLTIPEEKLKELNTQYDLLLSNPLSQEDCEMLGKKAIQKGELGLFWLNGGAATRYFDDSKVTEEEKERFAKELSELTEEERHKPKGTTKVIDEMTYLELKVRNLIKIVEMTGGNTTIPVIMMNSFITEEETQKHFQELLEQYPSLKPSHFHSVKQEPTIPRWTNPKEASQIDLYLDKKQQLSFAPGGHGDFLDLLKKFFTDNALNIKYLFFANIDNFGASISPTMLGIHIAQGKGRTVELAPKNPGDKGGAPCFANEKLVIVEQMKFPKDFNQDDITSFNTNTFWFTLEDLLNYEEELPYVLAEKNVNGTSVLQLERIACDVNIKTTFATAPRIYRFWPTKRYLDLLIFKSPTPANEKEAEQHANFQELLRRKYDIEIP